jgi:membrane protein implicated in regulation of membrane protease activity
VTVNDVWRGVVRVVIGMLSTVGLWAVWAIAFPILAMLLALYITRLLPLAGRKRARKLNSSLQVRQRTRE